MVGKSNTYQFTFSKTSPAISFSITPDGIHNGGVKITNGVKVLGENGRKSNSVELTVDDNTPRYIYYYNETYPNMGGRIHVVDECGNMTSPDERRHVEIPPPTSFTQNVKRKKKNLAKGMVPDDPYQRAMGDEPTSFSQDVKRKKKNLPKGMGSDDTGGY